MKGKKKVSSKPDEEAVANKLIENIETNGKQVCYINSDGSMSYLTKTVEEEEKAKKKHTPQKRMDFDAKAVVDDSRQECLTRDTLKEKLTVRFLTANGEVHCCSESMDEQMNDVSDKEDDANKYDEEAEGGDTDDADEVEVDGAVDNAEEADDATGHMSIEQRKLRYDFETQWDNGCNGAVMPTSNPVRSSPARERFNSARNTQSMNQRTFPEYNVGNLSSRKYICGVMSTTEALKSIENNCCFRDPMPELNMPSTGIELQTGHNSFNKVQPIPNGGEGAGPHSETEFGYGDYIPKGDEMTSTKAKQTRASPDVFSNEVPPLDVKTSGTLEESLPTHRSVQNKTQLPEDNQDKAVDIEDTDAALPRTCQSKTTKLSKNRKKSKLCRCKKFAQIRARILAEQRERSAPYKDHEENTSRRNSEASTFGHTTNDESDSKFDDQKSYSEPENETDKVSEPEDDVRPSNNNNGTTERNSSTIKLILITFLALLLLILSAAVYIVKFYEKKRSKWWPYCLYNILYLKK